MPDLTVLHLTDVHFGQAAMMGRWPSLKAQLLDDLDYLVSKIGAIDLIALTGDIANTGASTEFSLASDFLEELGLRLLKSGGEFPLLAVVPGNHDLVRPGRRSAGQRVLEELWDERTETAVFEDADDDLRVMVDSWFANYQTWLTTQQPLPRPTPDQTGPLAGDFASRLNIRGLSVGLLGLNSTFRHVSDLAREGSLTISPRQIQQASGGDLPRWTSDLDLCLVLTHHPLTWMNNGDEIRDALFNDAANVQLHLCGHLHRERYAVAASSTPGEYCTHQGQSLFGLESFGSDSAQERLHGYAVITLDQAEDGLDLKVWPRGGYKTAAGTWRIDRKAEFNLPRDSDASSPFRLKRRRSPRSARIDQVTERALPIAKSPGSERTSASVESDLLALLRSGDAVAMVGDRLIGDEGGVRLAFADFRASLYETLATGTRDDGTATTEHLLALVAAREPEKAKNIVAHFLGNPSEATVFSARRLLAAPWSAFVYLSPMRDAEAARQALDANGERYESLDATRTEFRIPLEGQPFILRLASTATEEGNAKLRLAESDFIGTERTPNGDWHRFARQLLARAPVVFMADSVTSLPLWRFITDRDTARKSYRPPAFLVCPHLEPHFQSALSLYGVQLVSSTVDAFAAKYLHPSRAEASEGLQRQRARRLLPPSASLSVESKRRAASQGSRDYLLGNNPTWGDILGGYAADLSLKRAVIDALPVLPTDTTLVLANPAGSGRTTVLMQCALELQALQRRVAWVDGTVSKSIPAIIEEVRAEAYDVVVVDDADVFGDEAPRLLRELRGGAQCPRRVIAGVRSVRAYVLDGLSKRMLIDHDSLSTEDVTSLVSVLRKHNAVANRRLSDEDVRRLILDTGQGQLLVGMIQATSGLPFAHKIATEYEQLKPAEKFMYGSFALVTAEREAMTTAQAQQAVGGDPRESWRSFNRLLETRLVRQQPGGQRYEVRHRVVAEEVRRHLWLTGKLASVVRGTLRAYAAAGGHLRANSLPERRTLIRLLNHSYLIKLQLDPGDIRGIYDDVERLLRNDFHYWLQRGSFEVERGKDQFALHALQAAMTTPGGEDDPKVLTEYALLRLRLARRVQSIEGVRLALDALEDLGKVIRRHGEQSPHTFVILAREGVPWLETAPIGSSEREELAKSCTQLLSLGRRLVATNSEIAHFLDPAIGKLERLALPSHQVIDLNMVSR
jgi:hypothetical protein